MNLAGQSTLPATPPANRLSAPASEVGTSRRTPFGPSFASSVAKTFSDGFLLDHVCLVQHAARPTKQLLGGLDGG